MIDWHYQYHYHIFILESLAENKEVDAVYLNFAKAYDKVEHGILLHKMSYLGIQSKLKEWTRAFLKNRTQLTYVGGAASREETVRSGIPQGSVLSPILFIIMINDITTNTTCKVMSFDDDTRVFQPISSKEHSSQLQKDLKEKEHFAYRHHIYWPSR